MDEGCSERDTEGQGKGRVTIEVNRLQKLGRHILFAVGTVVGDYEESSMQDGDQQATDVESVVEEEKPPASSFEIGSLVDILFDMRGAYSGAGMSLSVTSLTHASMKSAPRYRVRSSSPYSLAGRTHKSKPITLIHEP